MAAHKYRVPHGNLGRIKSEELKLILSSNFRLPKTPGKISTSILSWKTNLEVVLNLESVQLVERGIPRSDSRNPACECAGSMLSTIVAVFPVLPVAGREAKIFERCNTGDYSDPAASSAVGTSSKLDF